MKTLYESILDDNEKIDGHIHLFDHEGIIDKSLIDIQKRCVCFSDISFKYIDKYKGDNIIALYDDFIHNYYDPYKHILLATGENTEDVISICEKYPNVIKGIGELKCYSEYIHGKLPYGNLDWIRPILDYNKDTTKPNNWLPVYIHYNLDSEDKIVEFTQLADEYKFPIVLCHCGMYDGCNYEYIHTIVNKLVTNYDNVYVDISYTATDYYLNNPNKLLELNNKKIIIGTDINSVIDRQINNPDIHCKELYDKFYKLHRLGNYNVAIKNIFGRK